MDSDSRDPCQLNDISSPSETSVKSESISLHSPPTYPVLDLVAVMNTSSEKLASEMHSIEVDTNNTLESSTEIEGEDSQENSSVCVKSTNKLSFEVNVNAIESVSIEDQADDIKDLGLKVFDQQTLEKGIWEQVEQESQRLQTEEELAILDTTIKKKELLIKKSCTKQAKSKLSQGTSKSEQPEITELSALQAKQSLLRERLTKGIKPKDDEGESERDRKIRLGEMTPFGTIVGPKTSELHSSLNQYLQKQQELQMKMLAKKKVKRKMSTGEDSSSGKEIRHKGESDVCSPSPDKNQKKKRKKKEVLGSELRIVPGDEYLSPAPSPGELATIDFEESGSEYVPSEGSPDDDGDAEFAPNSEERSREKGAKSKQSQSVNNDKSTKGKKRKSDGGSSRPKRRTLNFSQDPEDWATDDSDWVCTDDELSSGPENSARKMKKIVKKEKDDGNEDDYYRRIKLWEKSSPGIREELEGNCHELDNDFKVPAMIWGKLYKYQQVGVQWFWELHQQGCGGILGDEMGLGKTVQVIAFLASLRLSRIKSRLLGYRGLGPVLIVCPTTVMHQWVREFHTWFPPMMVAVLHESGTFQGKRENLIKNMMKTKGVVITSYTAVVRLKDALLDADWHYIVLDEGHKIRNPDAQVTMVVKQFRTPHRLILSGSPVQNHLRELWSLMDFVFPGKLGTLPVFMAQFGVPIVQGGYANASEVMVATAFKCATVLKDTITPYLLRRMKNDVSNHISLPPKNEQVLFCRLTDAQRELYKGYLDCGQVSRILDGRLQIFVGLINLRKICNHPHLYSGGPKLFAGESEDRIPVEDRFGHWSKAGKMIVMEALLKMWYRQEHRVLIFTQSKQMLGIMESFIIQRGYKYLKLDGGTSISARQPLINKFNQDKSYFVMILTTKVGGLGVNLTGADRVVIYDPDWNPATDTQARERAWRIGQQNCVTVYRLITAGTIEEKMYHRQIFKQFLCNKVLKDPRQRRFFKSNDLLELFTLKEVDTEGSTETSAIFAGTGSQVHVKKKRSTHDKVEVKSPPKRKETKDSPKMKESKPSPNPKESRAKDVISSSPNSTSKPDTIQFSESKLQHMKQLAAMLSKKLAQKAESVSATSADSTLVTEACDISTNKIPSPEKSSAESTEIGSAESTEKSAAESSEKSSAESTEKNAVESSEKNAVASFEKSAAESTEKNAAKSSEKSSTESSDRSVAESELRLSCLVGEPTTSSDSGLFSSDATINGVVEVSVPANRGKENQYESKQRKVPDCPARNAKRLNQDGSDRRSKSSREKHTQESKKHKKHKKHKKERNATFEGERVPHLVRSSSLKSSESVDEVEHNSKQDDYVLRKLFSKTGLQTAMQHDKIMEGGHADYALIEGEAKKVAQEAVRALKESRRHCWSATSGVPTWTGSSGAIRPEAEPSSSRPKFGAKKKFGVKKTSTITSSDAKEDLPGSSGLLAKIRARNMLLNEKDETLPADKNIVSRSNAELLDDIRAFVAFGAQTDGQATTDEIISHFKDRLPSESSALFKQMLNQVCEFHRSSGGTGLWKLLPDFNW